MANQNQVEKIDLSRCEICSLAPRAKQLWLSCLLIYLAAWSPDVLGQNVPVGNERTLGAGHGNTEVPVGNGFVLAVPIYYQFNPRTGKGWEGRALSRTSPSQPSARWT